MIRLSCFQVVEGFSYGFVTDTPSAFNFQLVPKVISANDNIISYKIFWDESS